MVLVLASVGTKGACTHRLTTTPGLLDRERRGDMAVGDSSGKAAAGQGRKRGAAGGGPGRRRGGGGGGGGAGAADVAWAVEQGYKSKGNPLAK